MRKPFQRMLVWAALTFAGLCAAYAHEDTLIQLKGTDLVGLPKNYAPAQFDLKAFRLRIGTHEMIFSPFLRKFFEEQHDLRISASWYHDSDLPPYLLLHIQPKKKDFSYDLLLNLDTLDVIELSVVLQTSDSSTRYLPIALWDEWKKDITKSIRTLK